MLKTTLKRIVPKPMYSQLSAAYFALKYKGSRHECPFCGNRFRRLLPHGSKLAVLKRLHVVGAGYRENSECPRCFSFDRERLIYLYLKQMTNVFSAKLSLLHVAPETNLHKILVEQSNLDYVTADLDSPLARVKLDVTRIPFGDGSFDAVICNHVLEHVPDDRRAMAELYRVLKPGGWAILQVPISLDLDSTYEDASVTTAEGREAAFGQKDHVRLYGKDYSQRLESVGFRVESFSFASAFGKDAVRKYGLLEDEKLYIGRKPTARGPIEDPTP